MEMYDDSNILYDDLSGHGTAVAGIMGAKRENKDREEEDAEAEEPGDEVQFDGSFLTEQDNCVSEGVPQEIPEGFTEPEADEETADPEAVSPGEEEDLPAFRHADNYADHYAQIDGVNPNARIYSARVLDEKNHAPIERVIEGIDWAVAQGVDILNISWGTDRDDERLHRAVKSASDKGILNYSQ
ncbi:MAG: S8 family serine peptidase [Eubacterium sp.]|nr:S8 family serine peptidase [Eubacterium sp.]